MITYPITNPIVFAMVMHDAELCRELLCSILPEKKIKEVRFVGKEYVETEKTIFPGITAKSVRLDVLFEDDDAWYDLELQMASEPDLAKRTRYYHSVMDIHHLRKGEEYNKLKPSYVIFICPEKCFLDDEPVLRFTKLEQNSHLPLGDNSYTIIVNTGCSPEKIPNHLRPLFDYINGQMPTDGLTRQIHNKVSDLNNREEVRNIMTLEEQHRIELMRAKKEGYSKGAEEGYSKAIKETAKKMKQAGTTTEVIASCTGLTVEQVEKL